MLYWKIPGIAKGKSLAPKFNETEKKKKLKACVSMSNGGRAQKVNV
jgi:hypothetical protein